jgi:hypothetical protein
MQKHQVEINLTKLKEIVGKKWGSENKDKFFRTYTDKSGVVNTILTADLNLTEPKYATKGDGSKIESDKAVLHDTGFLQVSEKVGDEWENANFGNLKQWVDKVDTTPPSRHDGVDDINPEDIPF